MPKTTTDFASLGLLPTLSGNLASLGYLQMTPIQQQALPMILAGNDVLARAKTGSGKTAAFGLGLLSRLDVKLYRVQALVICPTRELADQVASEVRRLARQIHNIKVLTLCGGRAIGPQVGSLTHGAHIVVGTPGRLLQHLRKNTLRLAAARMLVLDEADRMLDMGFEEDLVDIIAYLPDDRQTLLFSATYPAGMDAMSGNVQKDPAYIDVAADEPSNPVTEHFYRVAAHRKPTKPSAGTPNSPLELPDRKAALDLLLKHFLPESTLVFCNTKIDCRAVANTLGQRGFSALALHGDLEQRDRDEVLIRFANRSANIVVATDVAARGLDIKDLAAVVNFELPTQSEVYVHRIGRTARAGRGGLVISLFSDSEVHRLPAAARSCAQQPFPFDEMAASQLRAPPSPTMTTLCINGGRKNKLRPGDILGTLTADGTVTSADVGKINVTDHQSYVAIVNKQANRALSLLAGRMKGRTFQVRPYASVTRSRRTSRPPPTEKSLKNDI